MTSLAMAAGLIALCVAPVLIGGRTGNQAQSKAAAKAAEVLRANNFGVAYMNMQRADEAREILEEITQSQPADARGWYNLGLLEKSSGNSEAALAAFTRALVIDP